MERVLAISLAMGGLGAALLARPSIVVDRAGWLRGPGIHRIAAHSSWYHPHLHSGIPLGMMAHYTNTKHGTAGVMAHRRTRPRTETDRRASWHITIAGDGQVVQMIPCLAGAWHCRKGYITRRGQRFRINRAVLGIELEGHGRTFPPAQIQAAMQVWTALIRRYRIPKNLAMLQHSTFDPERRKDPGPIWMTQVAPTLLKHAYRWV